MGQDQFALQSMNCQSSIKLTTKYAIGCVHLTTLTEETLSSEQSQRLIYNRSINIQGGKNNNLALDEYLEMLNRDSKEIVKGHQTKTSIISHSKEFPHLINFTNQFDIISQSDVNFLLKDEKDFIVSQNTRPTYAK